jgi:uncharacterized cupin superfamily protein
VIDGAVVVRVPDREVELDRGGLMRFAGGPGGAHQITNRREATARLLPFSKAALPAISVYPDTDTIGIWPDDDTEFYFKRSGAVPREDAVLGSRPVRVVPEEWLRPPATRTGGRQADLACCGSIG